MPRHMLEARDAVEAAAAGEPVVLLTDQEVVVKFVPGSSAPRGIRTLLTREADRWWRITLLPPQKSGPIDEQGVTWNEQ